MAETAKPAPADRTIAAERTVLEVVREVKGPRPVLSPAAERALTPRQREILDVLFAVFDDGFAHLTMGEIAAAAQCSLRTLYELAPSRNELVGVVVDRRLWAIGRQAVAAIEPTAPPLDAIRSHLRAAHMAVVNTTEAFATDASADPETDAIQRAHADYLIDVTRALLDEAVRRGDIAPIDTAAVARVLANVGADFAGPSVIGTLQSPAKQAADTIVDLVITGLTNRRNPAGAIPPSTEREETTCR